MVQPLSLPEPEETQVQGELDIEIEDDTPPEDRDKPVATVVSVAGLPTALSISVPTDLTASVISLVRAMPLLVSTFPTWSCVRPFDFKSAMAL